MNSMDKIIIEVDKNLTSGTFDCYNNGKGISAEQLMYAACMLIDTLLENKVFTLGEVLDIVKEIPNAQSSNANLRRELWS